MDRLGPETGCVTITDYGLHVLIIMQVFWHLQHTLLKSWKCFVNLLMFSKFADVFWFCRCCGIYMFFEPSPHRSSPEFSTGQWKLHNWSQIKGWSFFCFRVDCCWCTAAILPLMVMGSITTHETGRLREMPEIIQAYLENNHGCSLRSPSAPCNPVVFLVELIFSSLNKPADSTHIWFASLTERPEHAVLEKASK